YSSLVRSKLQPPFVLQFTIRFHFALSCRPLTFSLSTHRYGSAAGKGRSSGFGSSKMDLPSGALLRRPSHLRYGDPYVTDNVVVISTSLMMVCCCISDDEDPNFLRDATADYDRFDCNDEDIDFTEGVEYFNSFTDFDDADFDP
ncbi:hypothetical protein LINPERPRIM_LOCUS2656, partial [Linum perenne]